MYEELCRPEESQPDMLDQRQYGQEKCQEDANVKAALPLNLTKGHQSALLVQKKEEDEEERRQKQCLQANSSGEEIYEEFDKPRESLHLMVNKSSKTNNSNNNNNKNNNYQHQNEAESAYEPIGHSVIVTSFYPKILTHA